jgi:autotransporter-associated beta strand protein
MTKITLLKSILLAIVIAISGNSWAGTKYFGGTGTWTGSVWSTTNAAPYNTAWVSGDAAVFNVASSTITGAATAFSGITANESVTVTASSTITTGGTVATITVASGKTFNFGSQAISTAAGTGFIKEGAGILSLAGGTYPGGFTLNTGMVVVGGVNALGTGALIINGGTLAASATRDLTGKYTGGITIGGNFTIGSGTTPAVAASNITFTNNMALGGVTRTITIGGTGTYSLGGIISNGGLTINNTAAGTITLAGANTYSGGTIINGGMLQLGATGVLADAGTITLNGGTLRTGASTGFTETVGTLNLTNNSTIVLGSGSHTLTFAASNGVSWTAGKTLNISGWAGTIGNSGTAGKIFVGNDATGVTAEQLAQISFDGATATILSTGELVPSQSLVDISGSPSKDGGYASLGSALAALNTETFTTNGNILISLKGSFTESANIALGVNTNGSTITIKPAVGVTPTITFNDGVTTKDIDGHFVIGSSTALLANLIPTHKIIIDGSNTVAGTTKDLTLLGPVTSNTRSVIRIFGDNDNVSIKNCVITNRSTSGSTTAPINVTNYFLVSNFSPDNLTIQNNTINSVDGNGSAGINIGSSGTPTVGIDGLVIRDNIVFGRQRAMFITYTKNADIYGNTISEISQADQSSAGISFQSTITGEVGTYNFYNNKIIALTTLNKTAGANNGVIGIDIQCGSSKTVNVYNNTISGMRAGAASTSNSKLYAIRTSSSSSDNIYNNTIYIPEGVDMTTFGTSYIGGIAYTSTAEVAASPGIKNIYNNIIISDETGMKTWGIRRVGTAGTFTSNNNIIYRANATNGFIGYHNNADASDLAAWRTASSQDADSKSVAVNFANTVTGDLTLTGGSISDINLAVPQLTTVNTDLTGASRYVITYAGAYESTRLPAYFQSKATGNWDAVGTWQVSATNNTPWVDPVQAPTNFASAVNILTGHLVTVNTIANSSSLNIKPGAQLTINDTKTLAVSGDFIINSSASSTGSFKNSGTLTVSGASKVQQYLTNQSWYLTSPVNGTVTPTNLSRIQSYVEGSGNGTVWSASGTTMTAGKGYITDVTSAPNTVEFTGPINSGNLSIGLSRQAATDANKYGFNLIGNPYTAYLDWTAVATANVSKMPTSTMWYRTKVSGSWAFSTVNGAGEASPADVSSLIPPMQAFWVRASTVGSSTLELTNNMVFHDNNSSNKLKAPTAPQTERTKLRLQVSNGTNSDEMLIYTDAQASNAFDWYDSPKMSESTDMLEISSIVDAESLVINGLNSLILDTALPIRFMTKTANAFTIKANQVSNLPEGIKVILSDYGTEYDLTSGAVYDFTSDIADNTNRFSLIFRTPGAVTGLNKNMDNRIMVYSENKGIAIRVNDAKLIGAEVSVYNAVGQQIISKQLNNSILHIDYSFTPDVYFVKVNNITKKVIVK